MNWNRLLLAGIAAAGLYVLRGILFDGGRDESAEAGGEGDADSREPNGSIDGNEFPPPVRKEEGFFSLEQDEQLDELLNLVKTGDCYHLFEEAGDPACRDYLLGLLVRLLGMKDERMLARSADTLTSFGPGGEAEVVGEDVRMDDTDFKESLLYVLRDNMPPDHPLLDRMACIYANEENGYTRYKIVRAMGIIGGRRARSFLERVVTEEGPSNTFAAQVARKYLSSDD